MADDKTWAGLPRKTLKIALPTVAALGAGGAIAVAAIPSADGTISACYRTDTDSNGLPGALRVIDESNECSGNEQAISWNQQGPPGAQGPQGQKGDQGNKGDQGDGATTPVKTPTSQAFLKLDGIDGSSQDKTHKGQIDIESFSWGAFRSGSNGAGSGGGGAGKAKFRDFHFQKLHDRSSAKLFKFSATGQRVKSATFSVVKDGKETIRYKLTNLTVESYDTKDTKFGEIESIALAPLQVEVTFSEGGTTFTSSFDVKQNKKPVINHFAFKTSAR